eukprot:TRINITY_DN5533_c0_g1_i6.p3 TRINITY_DN5533_c0_g1~~TRINITY_DN5533_c0_g1_i6.p3  ORF type:complete len:159 (-),score=47.40 TRINITY_DN5533_c0_g1_i6:788-1264(-)
MADEYPPLSTDLIKIMEQRLSAIEHRSNYLQDLINQPTATATEYSTANKELRRLESSLDLIKQLRAKQKEIDGLSSLLNDCQEDKDMHDMAAGELMEAVEEEKRLQHLLLKSLLPKDDADDRDCILEALEVKRHLCLLWIYSKCMRNTHKRRDGSLIL